MATTQLATAELDRVFAALSDPTRREILTRLGAGDATVSELAEPFPISLPAISRHLKVLENAGLITRDRRAQWRSNSLHAAPLKEATTWMEHLTQLWDARFDRLDAHLEVMKRMQDQPKPDQPTDKDKDQDDD
ncbi:ArsR/SmtB family transcription factor [Aeromicrobium sp.]|uniref:ArsR/SmtB family transcription factor n=1 Tax=Aeromicrobium sp. TaxID=1871063 RepID=UPI003D6A7277